MAYCSSCGNYLDDSAKFCSVCGAQVKAPAAVVAPAEPVVTAAPVAEPVVEPAAPVVEPVAPVVEPVKPAAPVYCAPAEPVRTYTAAPIVSTKTKVFGFVGMGLGIGSLFFAVLGIIYTAIGMFGGIGAGFGFSIGFGIFSAPCGIIGIKFCNDSYKAGNTSKVCNIGKKLAIAGIIVSGVMAFLGFIDLIISTV